MLLIPGTPFETNRDMCRVGYVPTLLCAELGNKTVLRQVPGHDSSPTRLLETVPRQI